MNGTLKIRSHHWTTITLMCALATWLFPLSLATQAQPMPSGLSRGEVERISNDLSRSSTTDFFRQGQEKLEREIRWLDRRRLLSMENLLKVSGSPPTPVELNSLEITQPSPPTDR